MSNERFPHPNGHHRNDDPQPERWADASASDADALDALLNGIAQGNGSPNTRSGRGHQRPDVRTERRGDTGEAATLHAATRDFHRRFDAAETRDTGATALDPHLWETIMTATTPPSTVKAAPGTLWRDATSPSPTATTRRGRPQSAASPPPGRWAPVANATLALVILLAGFGIWRVYDGMNGAAPVDPEGTVPGLAMQPATPEPTERPAISAAAIATPDPISACDFTTSIPIFPDVDASPINGTALLLTTTGELVLTCPAEPESIVLASGIEQASPLNWPGIVSLIGEAEAETQPISVINIITGKIVKVGLPPDAMRYGWTQPEGSPWLVAPAFEDTGVWMITDMRTMESQALSSFENSGLLPGATVTTPGTPLIVAGANDTIALGIKTNNDIDGEGALFDIEGLPGTLLVLNGTFENSHWIDIPDDLPKTREMLISPDGEHLALKSNDGEASFDGTITYTIVRVSDGTEVARSEGLQDFSSSMRWVQKGDALAYTNDTALMLLSTTSDSDPVTLLQGNDALVELGTTYDPDFVIVHRQQAEEVATETPGLVQPRIYSVNTVSGEAIEIDGVDVSHNLSPWEPDTRFLVMGDTYIQHMNAEIATFRVVDAVTGEVLDELSNIQISQDPNGPMMGLRSVVSTTDGGTEVIGFGASQVYLLRELDGTLDIRQLPSPNPDIQSYIGSVPLWLASDGSQVSLTIDGDESGTRYFIDLTDPDATWVTVPSPTIEPGYGPSSILFVPGAGE